MQPKIASERGQVLVLIVLAIVGLFGFTSLAIDGGRIFADRRYAQNGADAATLAGAGGAANKLKEHQDAKSPGVNGEDWNCSSPGVLSAIAQAEAQAVVNAGNNGFTITDSDDFYADGNIVVARCINDGGEKYIEVRVSITLVTQTSFAHFVFQGPTQNTVDAISRVYPRAPLAGGHSLISLTDSCDSAQERGTRFSGGEDVFINGGGIFSNSCIESDGTAGAVTITNGVANYYQDFTYDGEPVINPYPEPVDYKWKPTFDFPSSCVGDLDPSPTVSGSHSIYYPGQYTSDILISGGGVTPTVDLEPGLYCFRDGADFKVNKADLTGPGVTFYFTSNAGGFDTAGNGTVYLTAPVEPCDTSLAGYSTESCDPAVPNLLIYMEAGNTNDITLGGGSSSYYEGTVYAETAQVRLGGTSSKVSHLGVQVIANSIWVHGTVDMNITYDDSLVYHTPNKINLEK